MSQAGTEVLPFDRMEDGHMLLQAELEVEAVRAHPPDARLDYGRAGIRKAQVGNRVATHLDAELSYGLHGNEAGCKPTVN